MRHPSHSVFGLKEASVQSATLWPCQDGSSLSLENLEKDERMENGLMYSVTLGGWGGQLLGSDRLERGDLVSTLWTVK